MATNGPRMLLVDDSDDDTLLTTARLKRAYPELVWDRVDDAPGFKRALKGGAWDLVICDHTMPRFDSLSALALLRASGSRTPFLVYSGHYDRAQVLAALDAGAVDCIEKADPGRLVPVVQRALARGAITAEVPGEALRDAATGLPGAPWLDARLGERLQERVGDEGSIAVVRLELDRVQRITQSYGQAATDRLLAEVVRRMQEALSPSDLLARTGPGEFAVLLDRFEGTRHAERRARLLVAALGEPFAQDGNAFYVTASAGYAVYPAHGRTAESLWRLADAALAHAREHGVNRIEGPVPAERAEAIAVPVAASELFVMAQPIVTVPGARPWGVEVLARRHHPDMGLLAPDPESPVDPPSPLGNTVAGWLLEQAVALAIHLRQAGRGDARVSVNLSRRMASDTRLAARIATGLAAGGIGADALEIEVSEAWVLANPQRAEALAAELKRVGLRLAIDDFGTTYGALAPLQNLGLDTFKLAPSLVREARGGRTREAVLEGAVALARALGARIVARGVETQAECDRLHILGVDRFQGPLYPPVRLDADRIEDLLPMPSEPGSGMNWVSREPGSRISGHRDFGGPLEGRQPEAVESRSVAPGQRA